MRRSQVLDPPLASLSSLGDGGDGGRLCSYYCRHFCGCRSGFVNRVISIEKKLEQKKIPLRAQDAPVSSPQAQPSPGVSLMSGSCLQATLVAILVVIIVVVVVVVVVAL